jgi:hypothetical protein
METLVARRYALFDAAPTGANRVQNCRCYKDFAPTTELGPARLLFLN